MAIAPTSVPAGVRATITLLARIHADLDGSAQTRTTAGPSLTEHASRSSGSQKGAQRSLRAQSPASLRKAS